MQFNLRPARKTDLDQILQIESATYPVPWDRTAFEAELSKQASDINIFLVAEDSAAEKIAGYIVGNIIIDYVHILNIAVAEGYKRKGIASRFMNAVEQEAIKRDLSGITLEVRETNQAAVNLYKKQGFVEKGRRIKYYENTDDGLIMWKTL